jgi:stringent starvation protein B
MKKYELIQHFIAYLQSINEDPHIVLQTQIPGTCGIPPSLIGDRGLISLNLSARATDDTLRIGEYQCQADMRFKGEPRSVAWHVDGIELVYGRSADAPKLVLPSHKAIKYPKPKPTLKVVK